MNIIELENRSAQEVFEELKQRLESQGYLPDEYFLLDYEWENGRKIPENVGIFCTTDYGGSEGVYLDVYLKWYEGGKPATKSFITGKTLGESGNDLDRMFLISSAITKAFHGDHATHARFMEIGGVEDGTGGAVVHGDTRSFVDCFISRVPHPVLVTDLEEIYCRTGVVTTEQQANAEAVYNLVRYGSTGGTGGSDAPFISADGFCSPVGANWRSIVTSEFGYRKDPFTGQTKGHSGMDLAVPTGTSVRAALPGTVTISQYSSSYGYYVMIDHGGSLSTLYAHNSKLLVKVGQTVQAGDVVSLSGSTGRSTGPHLHFEVRVNGERTDPRSYLP